MNNKLAALVLTLGMCVLASPDAAAAPSGTEYEVQETWELHLDTPNLTKNTPQFVTHFKIDADTYVVTCFNFKDQPVHDPGGIQVQLWDQGNLVDTVNVTLGSLDVSGDVVRWTQRYKIDPLANTLTTYILGISSQAWGQINNSTGVVQNPAGITTFVTYDPAESVADSHINYGRNAVTWFGMTECRKFDDRGKKLWEDLTDRPVFAR